MYACIKMDKSKKLMLERKINPQSIKAIWYYLCTFLKQQKQFLMWLEKKICGRLYICQMYIYTCIYTHANMCQIKYT